MTTSKAAQAKSDSRPPLPALKTSELLESKTSPVALAEYEKLAPAPPPPDYPGPSEVVVQSRELPPRPPAHSASYPSYSFDARPAPALQQSFNKDVDRCDHRETRRYGVLGIIVGVVMFPVGLICTRLDSRLVCKRCGATLYKTPEGWYAEQRYGVQSYQDARGR